MSHTQGSSDTHPRAERVQIQLLRQASTAARFSRARSLSKTTIELARRAIRRQHTDLSERDVQLLFVEQFYGKELASSLGDALKRDGR